MTRRAAVRHGAGAGGREQPTCRPRPRGPEGGGGLAVFLFAATRHALKGGLLQEQRCRLRKRCRLCHASQGRLPLGRRVARQVPSNPTGCGPRGGEVCGRPPRRVPADAARVPGQGLATRRRDTRVLPQAAAAARHAVLHARPRGDTCMCNACVQFMCAIHVCNACAPHVHRMCTSLRARQARPALAAVLEQLQGKALFAVDPSDSTSKVRS